MNKDYKSINNLWKDSEGYRYFGTLKLSSKIKYDGDDFIPLWEWINQLQQENKKLNGAIQTYDILLKSNIEENQQLKIQISAREEEYKKLEDNWNYIKKMLKEARQEKFNVIGYCGTCTDVDIDFLLDKMQEMEKNYGNVEDNT